MKGLGQWTFDDLKEGMYVHEGCGTKQMFYKITEVTFYLATFELLKRPWLSCKMFIINRQNFKIFAIDFMTMDREEFYTKYIEELT